MILGVAMITFTSQYWKDERNQMLREVAQKVASVMEESIQSSSEEDSITVWQNNAFLSWTFEFLSTPFDLNVFVADSSGQVWLCRHSYFSQTQNFTCVHRLNPIRPEVLELLEERGTTSGVLDDYYREKVYSVGMPVDYQGKMVMAVFASTPVSTVKPYVNDILQIFLLSTALALIIAFVCAYMLTLRMVRPLRQMAMATRNFSKGDFSTRLPIESDDEMGELVQAFNVMALSLATLEATRRSFIANVSHELRTPMTTIGGFIDGILDGTIPQDKHPYYLRIVSDEVKRLSRLVVQMLNMSEIEAGKKRLQPTRFDISKRIFQIFVSFEKRIDEKMIEIRGFESMSNIELVADEDMLHQVIYNLVDNAIKFTPEGGYIEVGARQEQGQVTIRIRNSGEGLSPEEVNRVFERFYKVDKSRSKDVKGTGIGLYIVKSIIELHGGQIHINSRQGEYCEFEFWIPQKLKQDRPEGQN